jgi:hypothetical protein
MISNGCKHHQMSKKSCQIPIKTIKFCTYDLCVVTCESCDNREKLC